MADDRPRTRLSATVLGAPDPRELAAFYRHMLGWRVKWDEPDWVMLEAPESGAGLRSSGSGSTSGRSGRPAPATSR